MKNKNIIILCSVLLLIQSNNIFASQIKGHTKKHKKTNEISKNKKIDEVVGIKLKLSEVLTDPPVEQNLPEKANVEIPFVAEESIAPAPPIVPVIPVPQVIAEKSEDYTLKDLDKILNDKEVSITSFDSIEQKRIINKFYANDEILKVKKIFLNNLLVFLNTQDSHCEMNYIEGLAREFEKSNIKTESEMLDAAKLLRVGNVIDDVLYDILESLIKDRFAIQGLPLTQKPFRNIFKNTAKIASSYNMNDLFSSFAVYPDEHILCSTNEFIRLRENVGSSRDSVKSRNSLLKDLSYEAYDKKIISVSTYNKMLFMLTTSSIQSRNVWLNDYFKIIFSAKNKMIPFKRSYKVINLSDENAFSSERLSRFSKLTRRKVLYQKYDENQIVLLAQVVKKASQRMGVDPDTKTNIPYLTQEFKVTNSDGQIENVVEKTELDSQSQFNLARRLLRKDIVALQMMKIFQKVNITYEDLVMASLETGYISLDDVAYVVKYDDLWNSQISKYQRLVNITFKLAGYGTFFLPPPWNVTAGLALTVVEGIVESKNINGASNDNPNTFIE